MENPPPCGCYPCFCMNFSMRCRASSILLVGGGVAAAHEALAAGAEGIAGHDGHVLFLQQVLGEGLIVHAGGGDVGEGVERAARLEGGQAEPVQPVHDQPAAAVVLGHHLLHVAARRCCSASSAASWAVVGADMIVYWWMRTSPWMMSAGPQA